MSFQVNKFPVLCNEKITRILYTGNDISVFKLN